MGGRGRRMGSMGVHLEKRREVAGVDQLELPAFLMEG